MGREVRRVPPGWEHPRDERGRYVPLPAGPYSRAAAEWDEGKAHWDAGEQRDWSRYPEKAWEPRETEGAYEDVAGERPRPEHYMPEWAPGEATSGVAAMNK